MEYRFYRVLIFNEFSRSYKKDKTIGNFIIGWFVSPHHLSKHTDKLLLHFPTSYLILPTLLKLGSRNFYLDLEISEKASLYFPSHGFSSTFFFFFFLPYFPFVFSFQLELGNGDTQIRSAFVSLRDSSHAFPSNVCEHEMESIFL